MAKAKESDGSLFSALQAAYDDVQEKAAVRDEAAQHLSTVTKEVEAAAAKKIGEAKAELDAATKELEAAQAILTEKQKGLNALLGTASDPRIRMSA